MFNVWQGSGIQYLDLAPMLFKRNGEQEMIPFLGAGVSVSDRKEQEVQLEPLYPDDATLDQVANLLKLEGDARLYLEYAIRLAVRMQAWEKATGAPLSVEEYVKKLKGNTYPPFASELSELFSQVASYNSLEDRALKALDTRALLSKEHIEQWKERLLPMLKLLAMTTDLGSPTDSLASISSYYEIKSERSNLWKWAYAVVASKEVPTETHRLIAEAAATHLAFEGAEDYLIITTNYDWLMEKALDEKGVPYAVLWRNWNDEKIHTRFGNLKPAELQTALKLNPPRMPEYCVLQKNRNLVVLYKMHGCLYKEMKEDNDGLVITDKDYVEFISRLQDIIPSHVGALLGKKRLLFLGYSFGDWNVRSLYEKVIHLTAKSGVQDYAVTRSLSQFEQMYFKSRDIIIVLTDLISFSQGIRKYSGVKD